MIENEYMIRIINRKSFLLLKNCLKVKLNPIWPHCVLAIVSYFDSVANRQKYMCIIAICLKYLLPSYEHAKMKPHKKSCWLLGIPDMLK